MPAKKSTNIFTKGLVQSIDQVDQAKDSYSYGLNAVKENIINNPEVVSNEKGFAEYLDLGYEYVLLGTRYLGKKEYVLFIKEIEGATPFNRILLVKDKVVTTILNRLDLNFNSSHPIMSTYRINYKNQRIVYFVDGLNDDRVINIDIDSTAYDITLFSVNSSASKPILQTTVLDAGGSLLSGQYFVAISYNLGESYTTEPLIVSNPISIAGEDYYNNIPVTEITTRQFGQVDGDIIPVPTRKALELNITNIDSNFDSYNIIVLRQEETFNVIRVVKNIDVNTNVYTYTGSEGELDDTLTLNDIITNSVNYYASEAITQKDNRLIRGNSKLKASAINYQNFANNIVVKYKITEELVHNTSLQNAHKTDNKGDAGHVTYDNFVKDHGISPSYLANTANNDPDNKTFMRDEVYSLGIGFELVDGTETDVYHIPGRPLNYFSSVPTGTGEYNRSFTPAWDNDLVDGKPRWQVRNTAVKQAVGELAYWRSSETYPDNYNFPTNGELNGSGKSYIRHHKMPSDVLEPIYRTEITNDPNADEGQEVLYKLFKRNLGLDFSNIVIPPDLQGIIKKVRFFMTPRNSTNKSILSKGITYALSDFGEGEQSSTSFNSEQYSTDNKTRFEFISPEVNFNFKQNTLSGARIKVCGIDKGYIHYIGNPETDPNESGNLAYYIRTFNTALYNDNGRRQAITSAFCFYNQRAIPKEDIYTRDINKLIFIDQNFSGSTDLGNLNFQGGQDTSVLELLTPLALKPSVVVTPFSNYYPELQYKAGTDLPSNMFRNLFYSDFEITNEETFITYRNTRRRLEEKSWITDTYWDTTYYIQVMNNKTNLYGSISSLQYKEIGIPVLYTSGNTISATVNGGDTFIDLHHFKKTKVVPQQRQGDKVPIALNVYGGYGTIGRYTPENLITEVYEEGIQNFGSFFCETDINIRMRREGPGINEKYFPKSYYNFNNLQDVSVQIDNKEFYKIDTPYNNQYIKPYFVFYVDNDTLNENSDDIRYYTRIVYSDKQNLEDKTDNYRKVRANNYRDLPLDKGGITVFFVNQDKLYAVTRDTIFKVFTSNQNLQSLNETNITVGTGEFLGTEPIDLISIDGGFAGTTSKLSFVESPYGYLFVDRYKGKFILFNNEVNEISVKDINEFLRENYDIKAIEQLSIEDTEFDNPLNNYGYVCGFDAELNRFLITKLDFQLTDIERYKGIFNPDTNYEDGDIYLKDGKLLYVFSSSTEEYVELVNSTNLSDFIPGEIDPLLYSFTQPTNGAVTDNLDGTLTYTPDEDYEGLDSFTISSSCITGTVNMTVENEVYPFKWIPDEDESYCEQGSSEGATFSALTTKTVTRTTGLGNTVITLDNSNELLNTLDGESITTLNTLSDPTIFTATATGIYNVEVDFTGNASITKNAGFFTEFSFFIEINGVKTALAATTTNPLTGNTCQFVLISPGGSGTRTGTVNYSGNYVNPTLSLSVGQTIKLYVESFQSITGSSSVPLTMTLNNCKVFISQIVEGNTGYLIQPTLEKVTDDIYEYPLDINNNLTSVTGLPQDTMDNPEESSTYRILNTTACPLPDAELFSFTPVIDADLDTVYNSNIINITMAAPISIVDGEYRINGGTWLTTPGTVDNGDTVQVRKVSSASFATLVSLTLTVGSYSTNFDVTTKSDDSPTPFTFTPVTNAELSTNYDSNTITIAGL